MDNKEVEPSVSDTKEVPANIRRILDSYVNDVRVERRFEKILERYGRPENEIALARITGSRETYEHVLVILGYKEDLDRANTFLEAEKNRLSY